MLDTFSAASPLHSPIRGGRTHAAVGYVAQQFANKIALEQVAAICRLSPSRFCRVFKHEQGMSFGQYLMHYRLERACEQLSTGEVLTKEVAYAVGFNDLSYFTWAFKRQLGVCPSHYSINHNNLDLLVQDRQDRPND